MNNKVIVANWKAHLSPEHVSSWIDAFVRRYQPISGVEIILSPPFLVLDSVREQLAGVDGITLAAQGVSPFPPGNYTGATPAAWLSGRVQYALLGHRERRVYFHEDSLAVAAQAREAVAAGLVPVICVDDSLVAEQLAALDSSELSASLFAWTPDDAVRLETARNTAVIAEKVADLSRRTGRPALYGGGVNRDNCHDIMALHEVAGVLVGRGCLDADAFADMLASLR